MKVNVKVNEKVKVKVKVKIKVKVIIFIFISIGQLYPHAATLPCCHALQFALDLINK